MRLIPSPLRRQGPIVVPTSGALRGKRHGPLPAQGRRLWGVATLVISLIAAPAFATKPSASAERCESACLTSLADAFVAGLASRRQGADVPWTSRVLYTENGVGMTVGDGIWAAVTAHDAAPLVIADPASDSVVWIGGIAEHGQPSWLALRIKASGRRIAEAEAIIRRKEGRPPYADPTAFARDPGFAQTVPARMPRERLIALARGYLNSIAAHDGTVLTRFAPGCVRTENGLTMTEGAQASLAAGCEGQIKAGLFRDVDRVRGIAFPVIDPAKGLVVAVGIRDYSGRIATLITPDGRKFAPDTLYPHAYAFAIAFKIVDGAIARIEEVSSEVPYRMPAWKER